jgi:mono/diheme cytochrome c family protein
MGARADELGRKVFTEIAQPSCSLCHTLQAAGAAGSIGPSLDELKPDKPRVLEAVRKGLGVMPPFADKLTPEQIEAVAAYVAKAAQ